VSLGQAAAVAGAALLLMVVAAPFAEFVVYPRLVSRDAGETARQILDNQSLYLAGMFAGLATFTADIVVAWALYVLLAPVNQSLSLLATFFRLAYGVIAIVAVLKQATVLRILTATEQPGFTIEQLQAQALLLLNSYRYEYNLGLLLFGIHLVILGYLVYRSGYIPRLLGALLAIAGAGYFANALRPYLFPDLPLAVLTLTFFGELFFVVWLLARGWRLQERSGFAMERAT
jgi:hypothetical protein